MRLLWISLPFTAGQAMSSALDTTSSAFQNTAGVGLWVCWAVGMTAALIPHTLSLTPLRILAPASFAATVWAAIDHGATSWAVVGMSLSALAALVSLTPQIGAHYVDASSYGDERRVPLKPPGMLLLGPIPLAWLVVVVGLAAGPLLLAAKTWIGGAIAVAIGFPAAAFAARSLHRLVRRWLVFVPAGLVVHDHMSLADPVLFKRSAITGFGPALVDSGARDLSQGALGLALQVSLRTTVQLAWKTNALAEPTAEELTAVIISPSQPGSVLREAAGRRIPVG
jgi:hypothetical protein